MQKQASIKNVKMICLFEEIAIGSLLGDATLEQAKSGNCRF